MNALFLFVTVICIAIQAVTKKEYDKRGGKGVYAFSAASTLFAILVFLIASGGNLDFSPVIIPYSIAFSIAFCVSLTTALLTVMTGPLSLSTLINQYSLVLPTLYGLIFLKEDVTTALIIGLLLLFASLALVNLEKKGQQKKITLKWGIYVFLNFLGNGMCATLQTMQQQRFPGKYENEFMIIAFVIGMLVMVAISFVSERKTLKTELKKGFVWYSISGIAMGLVNLLVLVLVGSGMNASVVFPVMSAGGIILTAAMSIFFYKEKLSIQQKIGIILGIGAVIALNM